MLSKDPKVRITSDEGNPIIIKEPEHIISKVYMEIASKIITSIKADTRKSPLIIQ